MKNLELQNRILSKELAQVNQDNKKYIYQFYESNKLNQRINTEGDILIANNTPNQSNLSHHQLCLSLLYHIRCQQVIT